MIFESLADKEGGRSNINTPKGVSFAGGPFAYHGLVRMGDAARFLVFSGKCAQIL